MFIYQNGKLYRQVSDKKMVEVEIHLDLFSDVDGVEVDIKGDYKILTLNEVKAKFHEMNATEIKVAQPTEKEKEVVIDEPIKQTKSTTGKSRSK